MAKELIALISTHGKTTEQVAAEAWEAYQRFQRKNQLAAQPDQHIFTSRAESQVTSYKLITVVQICALAPAEE